MRVFSVFEFVVEVGHAQFGIEDHVFHHRAEAFGRGVDFRLRLTRQLDRLGVAAALEVEHAALAPAVLVVADERAVRVGRERRLAGAGEAEKDRGIAVLAGIGRAVHRHDVLRRQDIVEIGEDRFLDFAGVARAADQNDLAGEVAGDDRLGARAMPLGVGLEGWQIDDGQIGNKGRQILRRRTHQEIADEQRMPGVFGEDARLDAEGRVGAAVKILGEQRLAFGMGEKVGEQDVEMLGRHRGVVVPPHDRVGVCVADDELVLRAAAGVDAGVGDERPVLRDMRFMAL